MKPGGTGTLIPAAQFKIDKDKGPEIEAFGYGPWQLVNFTVWN